MTKKQPVTTQPIYQIKVGGHLEEVWSEWFDELAMTYDEHDDTLFTGPVTDQSALYGLIKKARDMGLSLISVNRVESAQKGKQ